MSTGTSGVGAGATPAGSGAATGVGAGWVQFEEAAVPPAVLAAETLHVDLQQGTGTVTPATGTGTASPGSPHTHNQTQTHLQLSRPTTRQGFVNGDVVVTLLPVNTRWPWITAAQFRPELVPEELMAQGLTLTVEEYVHAMELMVNDVRFTLYNICYKRVLICWIVLAFVVLMALLFSGLNNLTRFSFGVVWLLLNAAAIFICMWLKLQLLRGLEKCLARVNKQLIRHKLMVSLDDRGKISCHKVTLCFMYFDSAPCVTQLQQVIEREDANAIPAGWEQRLDITSTDIVIQGSQTTRLSRKQGLAEQVFLQYLQRWGKDFLRHRLDWTLDEEGGNPAAPRHLSQALCPCQYIEELLRNKPRKDPRTCFPHCTNWLKRRGVD